MKHSIPVSPAVKNYLEKWYPNHYKVNKDDYLGMWCLNALVRKTTNIKTFSKSDPTDQQYLVDKELTESWTFITPVSHNRNGVIFPKQRVLDFNNLILKLMYTELIHQIEAKSFRGGDNIIQSSIENFRDRYHIRDTDFSDDRVRKMYLRFRKKNTTAEGDLYTFIPVMLIGKFKV